MRDQLLEKISSLELRTKVFEEPNIQLAAAMEKAKAWETAGRQARNSEFKIRRLRTTTTVKHATAHDQNHVTVHSPRVVLRLG